MTWTTTEYISHITFTALTYEGHIGKFTFKVQGQNTLYFIQYWSWLKFQHFAWCMLFLNTFSPNADPQVAKNLYWLPSKLLNGYYQHMVEDRLCVERVLSGCLVPVTLKTKERMKLLFCLYNKLDEHAVE